ncbi:MAG: ABC transporter ATP-binding protein [Roseococcus sp.]
MSSEIAIRVEGLSKAYLIYQKPADRLRQAVMPRLRRLMAPLLRALGRPVEQRAYFSEFWALRALSFEVGKGETVGIIGRNGSGKSTLLQLVCGTLTPTQGEVTVHGRVAALLELGSGFNPEFTGRENVFLNAGVLGLTQRETEDRLQAILDFADIGEFIDQPVKTYSSGMAMRLAFAVIAHVDADVLIIDEALAVGDAFFQQKCFRWLREFQARGTVLFCGHDPGAIINLCTRAIWLDRGVVRMQGPAKAITEAYSAFVSSAAMGLAEQTIRLAPELGGAPTEAARSEESDGALGLMPLAEEGTSFGSGLARITGLAFTDMAGRPLGLITGGTEVVLTLRIRAYADILGAIVGFVIKDRLGQSVMGDNTFEPGVMPVCDLPAGWTALARFRFVMPDLAQGKYSITPAFASGTQMDHVQHHWVNDAFMFDVQPRRDLGMIVLIPMLERSVTLREDDGTVS